MVRFQVVIIGAGPVGLCLALGLGRHGVRTLVVDRLAEPARLPKMERVNPRTMEQFRRLGIAAAVRAAGFPAELPMDVYITETLATPPLVHHPQPSVRDLLDRGRRTNDGSMPAEPYQLVSQYTLEPILRAAVAELDSVTTRFGSELVEFQDRGNEVAVTLAGPDGATTTVESDYLVGCDGGASTVRKSLGIAMRGEPRLLELCQGLIFAPDLFERIVTGRGRHYHFLDEHESFLIVQDDTRHFTLHTVLDEPSAMGERFESLVGFPVQYVVRYAGRWTMRSMIADRYRRGRVFLAGDAAHLMNPTAGLGMNTGVGDAIDLGWKLHAVLSGWAPAELLDSYELERRPVGEANMHYSRERFEARRSWRSAIGADTATDPAALARIAAAADANEAKAGDMEGMELGYSYASSPLFGRTARPAEPAPVAGIRRPYRPDARSGTRLPHVWLDDLGTAAQDVVPDDAFCLLCTTPDDSWASSIRERASSVGVPLSYVHAPSEAARAVWNAAYVLVRPDLHVVWRGDRPTGDLADMLRRAIGADPDGTVDRPSPAPSAFTARGRVSAPDERVG